MLRILFIGATGYIGGTVLARLIQDPKRSEYDITVLLRSDGKAEGFKNFGLKTVKGSLDDVEILEKLVSEHDVVFQTADADHLKGTNAILRGFKTRYQKTGVAPILIHTSGTGILVDTAGGEYEGAEVYSDLNIPKIEGLPATQPHRAVDRAIVAAAEEGYARTWIVCPSTIWGIIDTVFVKEGLQKPESVQVPGMIELDVKLGKAVYVGEGLNVWPHVRIDEVGKFYHSLFNAIVSGKQPGPASGRNGYYFLESGAEYKQLTLAKAIAKALFARGKVTSPEAIKLSEADLDPQLYKRAVLEMGSNSRARGERSRQLGWNPPQTTEDFYASIQAEVDHWLKKH